MKIESLEVGMETLETKMEILEPETRAYSEIVALYRRPIGKAVAEEWDVEGK